MINEKNNFLTVSWLSGLLYAEIFISTGGWGVQMPPLTSENSYFLRSGPQGATLVMICFMALIMSAVTLQFHFLCSFSKRHVQIHDDIDNGLWDDVCVFICCEHRTSQVEGES